MTDTPKNRGELVELIASIIPVPQVSNPRLTGVGVSKTLLTALESAGLAVVPVEPTKEMLEAAQRGYPNINWTITHAVAASPYQETE